MGVDRMPCVGIEVRLRILLGKWRRRLLSAAIKCVGGGVINLARFIPYSIFHQAKRFLKFAMRRILYFVTRFGILVS